MANICCCSGLHYRFDGFRNDCQMPVLWQIERLDPLALDKLRQLCLFWWKIRQHRLLNLASLMFLNESCSVLDTVQRRRSSKCATGNDLLPNSAIVGGTMIERNLSMAE